MIFVRKHRKIAFAIMTVKSEADMDYPRMTNDPYADADAMDRYRQEQQDNCKKLRCRKCKYHLEDGELYYFIKTELDEIIICENCITDYSHVNV